MVLPKPSERGRRIILLVNRNVQQFSCSVRKTFCWHASLALRIINRSIIFAFFLLIRCLQLRYGRLTQALEPAMWSSIYIVFRKLQGTHFTKRKLLKSLLRLNVLKTWNASSFKFVYRCHLFNSHRCLK